jgi:photosystem II stability/assembly factor-like uncharacterized protein
MKALLHRVLPLCAGLALVTGSAAAGDFGKPVPAFHGGPHDMLYGVSIEGRNGVAVGDFGLVVESGDGGKTWTRQAKAPTDLGLFAVARKAGRCIAAGQQGLIVTADDCKQWRASPPATDARILAVDVNAAGVSYAVGGFGTLLKSADWGKTWQVLTPDWKALASDGAEPHLYDVHVADNGEVTVVGEFEMVIRSRDGGAHWVLLHKGKRSLFGLKIMDNGDLYAVGQEGLILKATENGSTWAELKSGTQSILTGIWAKPDGSVVASGIYTILYSADGGKSWRMDQSRPARAGWHQALAGSDEGGGRLNVVLVGSGGAILTVQR